MTISRHLSQWALPLLLMIILTINFLSMPAQECPGDAVTLRIETVTLLNSGRLRLPEDVVRNFAGDKGQYFFSNPIDGGRYSKYGIGNTLVYAPALFLEKLWAGKLTYFSPVRLQVLAGLNILFALGIATYLFLLAGLFSSSPWGRVLFVLSAFYATFWWNHLRIQAFEVFQPFFLIGAAYHLLRAARGRLAPAHWNDLLLAGSFLGFLCLLKTFYVILLPIFGVFLIVEMMSRRVGENRQSPGGRFQFGCFLAPIAIALSALLAVNQLKFGSCFETGYTQWAKEAHPMSGSILAGLWGYCCHPQFSVFLVFPVFTLGLVMLPSFTRRFPRETAFLWALGGAVIFGCAKFVNWSGSWSYGPRYLLPVLPLLSLPFLLVLEWIGENFRMPKAKLAAALVAGVLLYSFYLQIGLNSLPFYAVQCIQSQLVSPLKDPEVDNYFDQTPYPLICRDILNVKARQEVWWWRRMLQAAPPERRGALAAYFQRVASSNYYFFGE